MNKKVCAGMSDLIRGTWKMRDIELMNIQVGSRGPAHSIMSKKSTDMMTIAISAILEELLT
jgi:hypothetical protein